MQPMPKTMQTKVDLPAATQRLKKLTISLMRHKCTAFYAGCLIMGKNEVVDSPVTAYTDGYNCTFGAEFFAKQPDEEARGLIMHEKFHIVLMHMPRMKKLFHKNPKLANCAADFAANCLIKKLERESDGFIKLPKGGLYDVKFEGWSAVDIYYHLLKNQKDNPKPQTPQDGESGAGDDRVIDENGNAYDGDTFDEHGFDGDGVEKVLETMPDLEGKIEDALRRGGLLAGALGLDTPREISDLLEPVVRWQDELMEFVTSNCKGTDDYTWRRFDRRYIANDLLMPSVISETLTTLVFAIDTSGSITQEMLSYAASELASACQSVVPESVVVLWWDTAVHGQQTFNDTQYANIADLLKPQGGGGTRASCVFEYISKHNINAQAVVVLTDGYVESHVNHPADYYAPTLWLVTENTRWRPSFGRKLMIEGK